MAHRKIGERLAEMEDYSAALQVGGDRPAPTLATVNTPWFASPGGRACQVSAVQASGWREEGDMVRCGFSFREPCTSSGHLVLGCMHHSLSWERGSRNH